MNGQFRKVIDVGDATLFYEGDSGPVTIVLSPYLVLQLEDDSVRVQARVSVTTCQCSTRHIEVITNEEFYMDCLDGLAGSVCNWMSVEKCELVGCDQGMKIICVFRERHAEVRVYLGHPYFREIREIEEDVSYHILLTLLIDRCRLQEFSRSLSTLLDRTRKEMSVG